MAAGKSTIGGINAKVVLETSAGVEASPATADQIGATNESAAATDTSTSGLNGLLKRIAQRLTSLITLLTKPATATLSNVGDSASSVTVLAAAAGRLGATIYNDSSAILYLKLGTTASATSFTVILAGNGSGIGGYYEVPFGYTGRIDGIWASDAGGNARVTEITA